MKVLCIEGFSEPAVAPESCVGVPRGRSEALAGVRVGRVIEPRNQLHWGADVVQETEGNTAGGVIRESLAGPARSESYGMCVNLHAREPGGPILARLVDHGAGRSGNAEAVILR